MTIQIFGNRDLRGRVDLSLSHLGGAAQESHRQTVEGRHTRGWWNIGMNSDGPQAAIGGDRSSLGQAGGDRFDLGAGGPEPLPVFDLGIAPYAPVQELQGRLRQAVADRTVPGVILLLEHTPVITLGSRGSCRDLRDGPLVERRGVPVLRSERGGQATLHAPGQLVSYPVVPIPGRDLRSFVHDLEETLVVLLDGFGVRADRREGRPGLYVDGDKIASLGLRCQKWVASHGTALNVDLDLGLFDLIVSCGEPDLHQTSLRAVVGDDHESDLVKLDVVKARYVEAARRVFGWQLDLPRKLQYDQVEEALGLSKERAAGAG